MSDLIIEGRYPLNGQVTPMGNKNAVLPMIAASVLTDEPVILQNRPGASGTVGMQSVATAEPNGYTIGQGVNSIFTITRISGTNVLGMGGFPIDPCGHDPTGPAVDQRLAEKTVVKDNAAVHGGDAALVAAVLHALAHPFIDAPRVENSPGKGLVIKG